MPEITESLLTSATSVASFGDFTELSDAALVAAQAPVGALLGQANAAAASLAGEIARRSTRELGHSGLAQRNGFANASAMIEAGSRITRVDATKLVAVGALLASPLVTSASSAAGFSAGAVEPEPLLWRPLVGDAVRTGRLTVDAANSISRGLTGIDDRVAAGEICDAARELIARAPLVAPDRLFTAARAVRDRLDARGIAAREAERHEERYFSIRRQPDGMYRGSFLLAPEDGTLVTSAIDSVLAPRRGGPRFVDPARKAAAEKLLNDPRTNGQIVADAFADLIRLAVDVDPSTPIGSRRPAVRVIVTELTLHERTGAGKLEGNPDPVSFETVARHICDTGVVGVKFDKVGGRIVNVGREQRLFTERQRIGLAVRDGGCRFPDCDRPPSWCEAHHINQWDRDNGKTDIDDGVLLCRRHHMLLHDNHWQIEREGAIYWLRPPASIDPTRELIPMPGNAMQPR